jgi:formate dehydrogenase maturation protein FdhE
MLLPSNLNNQSIRKGDMVIHNCMNCGAEMFWAYDEAVEESEEFSVMTVLSCPDCNSILQFYFTNEEKV